MFLKGYLEGYKQKTMLLDYWESVANNMLTDEQLDSRPGGVGKTVRQTLVLMSQAKKIGKKA
jgi:hypothetical protein